MPKKAFSWVFLGTGEAAAMPGGLMGMCKVRGAGGRSRGPAPEPIQVAAGWFIGDQDPSVVPRFTNSSGSISQAIGAKRQCCSKEQQEAAAGRSCEPPAPAVLPPPKLSRAWQRGVTPWCRNPTGQLDGQTDHQTAAAEPPCGQQQEGDVLEPISQAGTAVTHP